MSLVADPERPPRDWSSPRRRGRLISHILPPAQPLHGILVTLASCARELLGVDLKRIECTGGGRVVEIPGDAAYIQSEVASRGGT